MSSAEYDVVVLGGGAAGENVADRAVQGGLSAAIVEVDLLGGACSYWACIPSKALLRPGQALSGARAVAGARQAVTGVLDGPAVLGRRDYWVSNWADDTAVDWARTSGIEVIRGKGTLSGVREVTVRDADGGDLVVRARHAVVIATGSEALIPDIPGMAQLRVWTSKEATSMAEVPRSVTILGGGIVAAEMATAFLSLGSDVHLIARSGLLAKMEPFCGELLSAALTHRGAHLYLNTGVAHVARDDDGVRVTMDDGVTVTSEELLVATGRRPGTLEVGLETVGLEPGAFIPTDDSMRVSDLDWLYAVGDVTGRALLTHQGKYQARAAGDGIVARATGGHVSDRPWSAFAATADREAVPQVIFTDPEIASVGHTARSAAEHGYVVDVVDYDLGKVSGAGLHADDYRGNARMVVNRDAQVLLGVTFAGPDVGELIHAATVAIVGQVPIDRLWHAVPSFPTMSEIWLRLLETYGRPTS
jgi:pyruvate/2-oxoglutarate dehydrogenase complex dihydrolipoamide dehydrogenase (E3) component